MEAPVCIRSATLADAGIITTVRKTRGDDIDAACGQLAGEVQDRTNARDRMLRQPVEAKVAAPNPGERNRHAH